MSKSDIEYSSNIIAIKKLLPNIQDNHFYKLHTILNIKVPVEWKIEDNRMNKDLHLLFVKGGKGSYYINNEKVPLYSGKIIFISNDCPHHSVANKDDPPHIIPIRFGVYNKITTEMVNLFDQPFSFCFDANNTLDFQRKFETLYHYHSSSLAYNLEACNAMLSQIFIDIYNQYSSNQNQFDRRIEGAKNYIESNPRNRSSLDSLAKEFGLSGRQFTRLFKASYGLTPKRFQLETQMKYASFLLNDTNMSIYEISRILDYPDQYSFSKQFKNIMGHNPSEARYVIHK